MTKENLDELHQHFKEHMLPEKPSCYLCPVGEGARAGPEVWLLPNRVWEIGADAITKSPIHFLAKNQMQQSFGASSNGLSLRFPRFMKERPDKSLSGFNCLTAAQLMSHYDLKEILKDEFGTDSSEIFKWFKADLERKQQMKSEQIQNLEINDLDKIPIETTDEIEDAPEKHDDDIEKELLTNQGIIKNIEERNRQLLKKIKGEKGKK